MPPGRLCGGTRLPDRDLRRRVGIALDFLAWMDRHGLVLADLAQEHTDEWITGASGPRCYLIRCFSRNGFMDSPLPGVVFVRWGQGGDDARGYMPQDPGGIGAAGRGPNLPSL